MSAVTITTEFGVFSADTIKEAVKAVEKGEKLARQEAARVSELRDIARCRAEALGFRIVARKLRGEQPLRGWAYVPHQEGANQSVVRTTGQDYGDDVLNIDTAKGAGKMNVYRNSYQGYIEDTAGYAMAIVIRLESGKLDICAVGAYDGVAACVHLPGYTLDDFRFDPAA